MVGWYLRTCALKRDDLKKKYFPVLWIRLSQLFCHCHMSVSGFKTIKYLSSHFCSWYFLFFYAQIIEASQFSFGTKTFGHSLAGNLDVDNNGYPGRELRFLTHSPFLAISIPLSPLSSTPPSLPPLLTHLIACLLKQQPTHPPPNHSAAH